MKKTLIVIACLAAMLAAGTGLKAQEVTITLTPGWTWISNPTTDTIAITEAFGPFAPFFRICNSEAVNMSICNSGMI